MTLARSLAHKVQLERQVQLVLKVSKALLGLMALQVQPELKALKVFRAFKVTLGLRVLKVSKAILV